MACADDINDSEMSDEEDEVTIVKEEVTEQMNETASEVKYITPVPVKQYNDRERETLKKTLLSQRAVASSSKVGKFTTYAYRQARRLIRSAIAENSDLFNFSMSEPKVEIHMFDPGIDMHKVPDVTNYVRIYAGHDPISILLDNPILASKTPVVTMFVDMNRKTMPFAEYKLCGATCGLIDILGKHNTLFPLINKYMMINNINVIRSSNMIAIDPIPIHVAATHKLPLPELQFRTAIRNLAFHCSTISTAVIIHPTGSDFSSNKAGLSDQTIAKLAKAYDDYFNKMFLFPDGVHYVFDDKCGKYIKMAQLKDAFINQMGIKVEDENEEQRVVKVKKEDLLDEDDESTTQF